MNEEIERKAKIIIDNLIKNASAIEFKKDEESETVHSKWWLQSLRVDLEPDYNVFLSFDKTGVV